MARLLHIVCHAPGMIRGGMRHPPHAIHALDAFTPDDLAEMIADPSMTLIVGDVVETVEAVLTPPADPEIVVIDRGVVMSEPPTPEAVPEATSEAAPEAVPEATSETATKPASKSQKKA